MMRKLLLFATLLLLPILALAQNTKRVAILETVDKYDKVAYGVEFQLRAFITDAVNKTPGYEGYDRVDMSQINKEHNFQRTGMVSDADIKKLGAMTGASSVVVAEAADYGFGDGRVIIAAKIINIESGRIENSTSPKTASPNGNGMESACKELVAELLGITGNTSNVSRPGMTSSEQKRPSSTQGYVDLGLPSGILWKANNESGFYDYDSAVNKYGNKLPTQEQWSELKEYCMWTWTGRGYKITGDNGNSIVIPAAGCRNKDNEVNAVGSIGDYWSSTPDDSKFARDLCFNSGRVGMDLTLRSLGRSVRLIKNP